jgi:hypothetical protein
MASNLGDGRTALTDTPIYDQLRLELSSRRAVPDRATGSRARAEKPPAPPLTSDDSDNRRPVSVWTLVNANRKR